MSANRANVIMKSSADNNIKGSSSFNIASQSTFSGAKINNSVISGPSSNIGGTRTQDQMYKYSSFARGANGGKRGGTALFAMTTATDENETELLPSETEVEVTGEGDTAWVDANYQASSKWDTPIDVEKNPLVQALKLGLSVFKDQKPPTIE